MEHRPVNPSCALSGTRYCELLNMHACDKCTINTETDSTTQLMADLDLYEELLPEGGIAQLFLSKECQFCKTEPKGRRQGYALLDMAHPEPKRLQRRLFIKMRCPAGTLVPVQMSICPRCRRRLLWIEYLPLLIPVALGVLGLALLLAEPINQALLRTANWLPFAIWAGIIVIGVVLGRVLSTALQKSGKKFMYTDVREHPVIHEMLERGWFPVGRESRILVIFSKSRRNRGLGTAVLDEEESD